MPEEKMSEEEQTTKMAELKIEIRELQSIMDKALDSSARKRKNARRREVLISQRENENGTTRMLRSSLRPQPQPSHIKTDILK